MISMTTSSLLFATLLTDAIKTIKTLESKNIAIIQDELGHRLGKKGKSSIEHWRKGHIPPKADDVATLARALVERGNFDRKWLKRYCDLTDYPYSERLIEELFPAPTLPTDYIPEPGPLPDGSFMELRRNQFFVGRQWDLQELAEILRIEPVAAVSQIRVTAAIGMGGLGKTQLASEFAHRYGQFFDGGVFWINFEDAESIPSKIAACGGLGHLNLSPSFNDLTLQERVKLVEQAWRKPIPRLLIFDNCEDEEQLHRWIPKTGGCRVLVTSRRSIWDPSLIVRTLKLGQLYPQESVELLKRLSGIENESILGEIASELGHLPLALHLAGKYLRNYQKVVSPETYLAELQEPDFLDHQSMRSMGISPTNHEQHVWRTFALSYNQLNAEEPTDQIARALLIRAAHFAPGEAIWNQLLIKTLHGYKENEKKTKLSANHGFIRLLELGLIEEGYEQTYHMHRLIAAFVQNEAVEDIEFIHEKIEQVVFEEATRINQSGYPVPLLAYHLHLRSIVDLASVREDERGAKLSQEMGEHLIQTGNQDEALTYFLKAKVIWEKLGEEESADYALCLFKIGHLYREQGQLNQAKPLLEAACEISKTQLSPSHPQVAEIDNEIGRWFYDREEMGIAQIHFEEAIDICQKTVGLNHLLTARCLNNLGMCLYRQGQYEKALTIMQKVLLIRNKVLGERHPDTTLSLNNIGFVLRTLTRYPEAQSYYEQALEIQSVILGEKHPRTGETLNNLGDILLQQEKFDGVQGYLEKSIEAFEYTFGPSYHRVAYPLRNLGRYWNMQGFQDEAHACLSRALRIRKLNLGDKHPLTKLSHRDLDQLRDKQ